MENKFLPEVLVMESISGRLRNLLPLVAKWEGLRIPKLMEAADKIHHASLVCIKRLAESLRTVEVLSTI